MFAHVLKSAGHFFSMVCAVTIPLALSAQVIPATKGKSADDLAPKWNLFVGYSYLSPHGTVQTKLSTSTQPFSYVSIGGGGIVSIARYIDRYWGLEVVGDFHLQDLNPYSYYVPRNDFSGGSGGVIYRFRKSPTTPFVHLLVGGEIVNGPHRQLDHWGPVGTLGGGVDYDTALFKHHMAIRLVQVDYQYVHENFGTGFQQGIANVNALRLSAGIVFHSAAAASREAGSLQCFASRADEPVPVKTFEPPTISCVTNPGTIYPDQSSTITANAVSPQNRSLTYHCTASAGTVTGTGTTKAFNPAGAPVGPVMIRCEAIDEDGRRATSSCNLTITPRPVPPVQHTQALCSISFSKDKIRPTRVDNEAKACLDEVALSLQKQPDAKAVIVGESDATEKTDQQAAAGKHKRIKGADPAGTRAVNAKDYLVTEKGIDAARISVATGTKNGKKAENYLVPSGATFSSDVTGTTTVDETTVKAQPRKPLPVRKHSHKKTVHKR